MSRKEGRSDRVFVADEQEVISAAIILDSKF
jgi:hypothetical protein